LPIPASQTQSPRLYPPRTWPWYLHLTDLRKAIARAAGEVSGRILDYGCGEKPYAPLFRNATQYIGADLPNNPHADIHLDAEGRLPQNVGDFDAVLSTQVLEHVPNVRLYLSECRRMLEARKGKLLLTTHGIWEYHTNPKDLYRWTHEGLVWTIEQAGFETCAIEPLTTGSRALLQIIELMILTGWPRGVGRILTRWPYGMDRIIWLLNYGGDRLRDNPNVEGAFRNFPIAYLYQGKIKT
jgi:SAM-dependent methyltransferase